MSSAKYYRSRITNVTESISSHHKTPWTEMEDSIVREAIEEGLTKWSDIALRFRGTRTGKQCRERWFNHLSPSLVRTPWTEREDSLLIKAHADFGNCWKRISHVLPGRSENEIKNRFYSSEVKRKIELSSSSLFSMHSSLPHKRSRSSASLTIDEGSSGSTSGEMVDDIIALDTAILASSDRPRKTRRNTSYKNNVGTKIVLSSAATSSSTSSSSSSSSSFSCDSLEVEEKKRLLQSIEDHRKLIPSPEDFASFVIAEIYLYEARKSRMSQRSMCEKEERTNLASESFTNDNAKFDGMMLYDNTLESDDNFSDYSTSSSLIHQTISDDTDTNIKNMIIGSELKID